LELSIIFSAFFSFLIFFSFLRDHLIDEVSGEVLYVYSREKEMEKHRRKCSLGHSSGASFPGADHQDRSLSTSASRSVTSPVKEFDDEAGQEAMALKVKRMGQSALSSLFGRTTAEGADITRQASSKALSDATLNRSVKRMPSLVNGVVVMAAIPSKAPDNAKGNDRWSPCSGSDIEQSDVLYAEVSDCASISTGDGSRDLEQAADHCKVVKHQFG
jgi:hypothetical protein